MIGDYITLYSNGVKATEFEVDSRSYINKNTKGRGMIHRPRFEEWGAKFELIVNEDILDESIILKLLNEGGEIIGIGSMRPEKGKGFGTFQVVSWELVKD